MSASPARQRRRECKRRGHVVKTMPTDEGTTYICAHCNEVIEVRLK